MAKVVIERGRVVVHEAPRGLEKALQFFRREIKYNRRRKAREATGHLEDLFDKDPDGTLTTFPGFAHRVLDYLRKHKVPFTVDDRRIPLPAPDFKAAGTGLRDYQVDVVLQAIAAGGGIVSLATGGGKTAIAAAIIRAYDPEELKLRNTPLVVMAAPDKDIVRKNWEELRRFLPGREVGIVMSGKEEPSEDVYSCTLDSLDRLNPREIGILIVDEVHTAAASTRTMKISAIQNAARWGLSATPTGRFDGGDMITEGLFGPIVASRTYAELVELGALVPIEVCWLDAPGPDINMYAFGQETRREARIRRGLIENEPYNRFVAEVLRSVPDDNTAICFTEQIRQMAAIHRHAADIPYVHGQTSGSTAQIGPVSAKERAEIYRKMREGGIPKIFATGVWQTGVDFPSLDVVINAFGGGSDIVSAQMPGRATRTADGKDIAYVVDFWHGWDRVSGGRPGPLLAGDFARRNVYRDLGFSQKKYTSIRELPFVR